MPESKPTNRSSLLIKAVVLVCVVALAITTYLLFGQYLSLKYLAEQETQLRGFQSSNPILVYGLAFIFYVTITGLSLPGAAALTIVYGWYFGFWEGVFLVSLASTTGATLAFLISRYLFRDAIRSKFGDRLENFNQSLEREGPFYLFSLRLIPAVPFFVINAVMGLTPIRVRTFSWISLLGMLPGTIVYVYAGSTVPDLQTLADDRIQAVFTPWQIAQIFIAFALLGLFPLAVRYILNFFTRRDVTQGSSESFDQSNSSEEVAS